MFGWFKQKTEMQKLIERTGYEKSIEECAALVGQRITTIRAFRQFILEELDAAQHGNAEAKAFVRSTGIPASEYNGAMSRSWPEVDGPDGPQQLLVGICAQLGDDSEYVARFRIAVVKKILSTTKPGVASAAGFKEPGTSKAPEVHAEEGGFEFTSPVEPKLELQSREEALAYVAKLKKLTRHEDVCRELANVMTAKYNLMIAPTRPSEAASKQALVTELTDKATWICGLALGTDAIVSRFGTDLREFNGLIMELDEQVAELDLKPEKHGEMLLSKLREYLS